MADIRKILEKVVSYEQQTKKGKKSKQIKLSEKTREIETVYVPSVTR